MKTRAHKHYKKDDTLPAMDEDNVRKADDYKVERLVDGPMPSQYYDYGNGRPIDHELERALIASMGDQHYNRGPSDTDLEAAIAESLRPSCPNCSLGQSAKAYIMCDECGTMMIKELATFTTSRTGLMCTNCGHINNGTTFANCSSRQCERLVELKR